MQLKGIVRPMRMPHILGVSQTVALILWFVLPGLSLWSVLPAIAAALLVLWLFFVLFNGCRIRGIARKWRRRMRALAQLRNPVAFA